MKKTVALVLAMSIMLGLLCGCSKSGASSAKGILNGKTIRIASWGDVKPRAGTEIDDLMLENIAAAEKKYGCKLEWVVITDLAQQLLTASTAGEIVAEVCLTRTHRINRLAQGDYIYSMEEIGDMSKDIYNQSAFANSTVVGKTYGFYYEPYTVYNVMYFNKSMLERNSVANPYKLVAGRKWNYGAWLDVMKGTTDPQNGIYGFATVSPSITNLIYGNNTGLYTEDNGIYKQNTSDPRLTEALQFLNDSVTKSKVMEVNAGASWDHGIKQFAQGRYATIVAGLFAVDYYLRDNMEDEYGILPLPIGPSASEYRNTTTELRSYVIQKAVPKNEASAILQFMDEALAYPLDREEGVRAYYESLVKDKESVDSLMLLQEIPVELVKEYNAPDLRELSIFGDFNDMVMGLKPIKSTLESHSNEIQSMLDDFYMQ